MKYIATLIAVVFFLGASAQIKNEAWYLSQAPFKLKMKAPALPVFGKKQVSILDFGAVRDGQTLNTDAFAKAIAACAKAGGGKVMVPAGLWLTGPIELQSNINLVVERGALVQFTTDFTKYGVEKLGGSSSFQVRPPIYGYNLKNVAITGEGVFDGGGDAWRPVKKDKVTASQWSAIAKTGIVSKDAKLWWPSQEAMDGENYLKTLKGKEATAQDYLPARVFLRPHMVQLNTCNNVLVEGVTFRNSPKFVFYPGNCTNLTMRNVTIFNEEWAQNGDGIDISACRNVLIYKCTVSAGDDGICMKSSSSGKMIGPRLENIVVAGCIVYRGHGGFVIGSNTDGGMNNLFVTDCQFIGTDIGIRVKSNSGRGGLVHNVFIRDIRMKDIRNEAISFDTYYEDVTAGKEKDQVKTTAADKVPEFRDFFISNIYVRGAKTAVYINGLQQMPVQKINFENMLIQADKAYEANYAKEISFKDSKVIFPNGVVQDLAVAAIDPASTPYASPFGGLPMKPHASVNAATFARQYAAYPSLWKKAFEFLGKQNLAELAPGKYQLAGDSVVASITYGPEKDFDSTKWEAHRKYIDLQYIIIGQEKMGVAPLASTTEVMPYNDTKDVANYSAEGNFHIANPSVFFLFFPQDVHRPNIRVAEGNVRKLVIKILVAK
jgi:YhcH/YjgK/YiaL family protein